MSASVDVAIPAPSILMIGPREHVLWVGPLGRIEIADRKLMWVRTANAAAMFLLGVLMGVFLPTFVLVAGLFLLVVLSKVAKHFIVSRALWVTPLSVTETGKVGAQSVLSIRSRHGVLIARAHPAMAEFLSGAITPWERRRFLLLRKIPATLLRSEMKQQMWPHSVFNVVVFVGVVWIWVLAFPGF